jgi:hypothetical protein
MCSGNQIDIVCDVKRLMFIEIIYWNIWLYSMVIIPGTAVTIGATLSMWQALLDFCLLFYAKKKSSKMQFGSLKFVPKLPIWLYL